MPKYLTNTRERILQAAYELFYAKGFRARRRRCRRREVRQSARAAREIALLLEGCVALMLIHGSADYAAAAAGAARRLVSLP